MPSTILIGLMSLHINEASFFMPLVVLQMKSLWRVVKNMSRYMAVKLEFQISWHAHCVHIFMMCPHVASGGMVS